jgi:hypothetical protein
MTALSIDTLNETPTGEILLSDFYRLMNDLSLMIGVVLLTYD